MPILIGSIAAIHTHRPTRQNCVRSRISHTPPPDMLPRMVGERGVSGASQPATEQTELTPQAAEHPTESEQLQAAFDADYRVQRQKQNAAEALFKKAFNTYVDQIDISALKHRYSRYETIVENAEIKNEDREPFLIWSESIMLDRIKPTRSSKYVISPIRAMASDMYNSFKSRRFPDAMDACC